MLRSFFIAIVLLLLPSFAVSQTATIAGHVIFPTGGAANNAKVCATLQNYKPNLPRLTSTGTIVNQTNYCFVPLVDGSFSFSLVRNDLLSPVGTFWRFDFTFNGIQQSSATYIINRTPFNLDTETPLSQSVPIGPNQIINLCVPFQQVTPASPWTIQHNEADLVVFVTTTDLSGNTIFPDNVNTLNPNVAIITWVTPQSGRALVCHGGVVNIATNQPNAIISNPTGPQTIISQPFTLASGVDFITNGSGTHNGIETFTNGITTNTLTDSGLTPGGCVQAGTGGLLTTPSATACGTGSGGVSSLNSLTGAVTIAAGANITVTPVGNTLTIDASSSGSVSSVGLALPPELSVANSPITSSGILTGTWNDQEPSTFLRGPAANGIGGIYDGTSKATGTSTSPSGTLTPSTNHDWAFFLVQSTGSQASPVSMPGPWVNQIQNGNTGAVFSNVLSSASPLTATATLASSNTWASMLLLLKYVPATTPTVVQKRSVSGSFSNNTNISFLSNTTPGTAVLVTLVGTPPSGAFLTATWTDSQGNLYTPLGQMQNGADEVIIAALTTNISGATADVLTLHTAGGPFVGSFMTVYELSNIAPFTRTPYFGPITLADLPAPLNTAVYTKFGISNSTTCPTGGSGGATCTFTVPWPTAWTDTTYAVTCTGVDPSNFPSIRGVTRSTNNVLVSVQNGTANMAMVSGYSEVDCSSFNSHP